MINKCNHFFSFLENMLYQVQNIYNKIEKDKYFMNNEQGIENIQRS